MRAIKKLECKPIDEYFETKYEPTDEYFETKYEPTDEYFETYKEDEPCCFYSDPPPLAVDPLSFSYKKPPNNRSKELHSAYYEKGFYKKFESSINGTVEDVNTSSCIKSEEEPQPTISKKQCQLSTSDEIEKQFQSTTSEDIKKQCQSTISEELQKTEKPVRFQITVQKRYFMKLNETRPLLDGHRESYKSEDNQRERDNFIILEKMHTRRRKMNTFELFKDDSPVRIKYSCFVPGCLVNSEESENRFFYFPRNHLR
ncbi:hypothetical protein L9F63_007647, partial [Diploptera punctata]